MPVILRLCVAIKRVAPLPPPTSILVSASPTAPTALSAPSAVTSTAVAPSEPAASPPPPSPPTQHRAKHKTSKASTSSAPAAAVAAAAASAAGHATPAERGEEATKAEPRHGRHNPLHWFKHHDHGQKKAAGKGASPPATAVMSKAASHESLLPTAAAATDEGLTAGEDVALRPSGTPATADSPAARDMDASQPSPPQEQRQQQHQQQQAPAQTVSANEEDQNRRLLVWLSVQLTPTSTVKSIVQQVQDMVRRRMNARLCEDPYAAAAFSASTTPAGSFANAPSRDATAQAQQQQQHQQLKKKDGAAHTVHVVSPTSRSASDPASATEWCLCVQDTDGVYHWIGGTRHFQKVAVLRAPFVTEVCLQSHLEFEQERQQLKALRKSHARSSGGDHSQHTSFTNPTGLPPALGDSNTTSSDSSSDKSGSSSSLGVSDNGSQGGGPGGAGRKRNGGAAAATSSAHGKGATKHDKKKNAKNESKAGARRSSSADPTRKLRSSSLTAKAFSKPNPADAKFAFLKGMVVPMSVLRQRNPALVHHRRKVGLYVEVHVPRELRADPLDPTTSSITAATAAHTHPFNDTDSPMLPGAAAAAGAAAQRANSASPTTPPLAPTTKAVVDAAGRAVYSPMSKTETVDVDVPPSAGHRSESSSMASSASTLPSRSPPLPQDGGMGNGQVLNAADGAKVRDNSSSAGDDGKEKTVRSAEGVLQVVPAVGLATHATTLEVDAHGLPQEETDAWCRTEDAAKVKKVAAPALQKLTAEEDDARLRLAKAQQAYSAAVAAYRVVVPSAQSSSHGDDLQVKKDEDGNGVVAPNSAGAGLASSGADAELAALMKRKLELHAAVEDGRQAERQCARLTTLVECLEKELRDHEERRALLLVRAR